MLYVPFNVSVDHLLSDRQRTAAATLRYAQEYAAKERRTSRRRTHAPRRAARA